jgi:hypothetical protein
VNTKELLEELVADPKERSIACDRLILATGEDDAERELAERPDGSDPGDDPTERARFLARTAANADIDAARGRGRLHGKASAYNHAAELVAGAIERLDPN